MKKIFNYLTNQLACVFALCMLSVVGYGQCPVGQTEVTVEYTSGTFNGENSWQLWDATAGVELVSDGTNPTVGLTPVCATDGNTLELYAYETFGDNWNGATLSLSTSEDGTVNGCAEQMTTVYGPDGDPGGADGNGTIQVPPTGALAFTGSFACVVPTCEIVCPADIVVANDPGLCEAFVELSDPQLIGDCQSSPVDFEPLVVDLGLPSYGVTGTGLDCNDYTIAIPALPSPCVSGGTLIEMELCLVADWGGATTFESSAINLGTCAAPGANLGTLGLGGVGDCNEDCVTVMVPASELLGGTLTFHMAQNFAVDDICGGDDILTATLSLPTGCESYVVEGAPADGIYPVGETCITYSATGSGTGSGAPDPIVSCTFKVNVQDTEAPTFVCPLDQTINLQGGECCQLIDFTVSATDNCPVTGEPDLTMQSALDDATNPNNGGAGGWSIYFNVTNVSAEAQFLTQVHSNTGGVVPTSCTVLTGPAITTVPAPATNWTVSPSVDAGADPTTGNFISILDTPILIPAGGSIGVQVNCAGAGPDYYNGPCAPVTDGVMEMQGFYSSTALSGGVVFQPRCFAGTIAYAPSVAEFLVQVAGQESGTEFSIGTTEQVYTATDDAGNVAECRFNIVVNEIPESTIVTSLTCNDNVNVSTDENCEVFINADMFLEGSNYGCYYNCYEVYIKDEHGNVVSSTCADPEKASSFPDKVRNPIDVNGCSVQLPCGSYTYEVYDACNDNLCWGNFEIEDKIAPALECPSAYTVNCTESTTPVPTVAGTLSLSTEEAAICWADADTGEFSTTYDFGPLSTSSSITDVNFNMVLDHSWTADITSAVLTSPSGTDVVLFGNIGFLDHNVNCTFDESSALTLNAGNVTNLAGCNAFGAIPDDCDNSNCDGEAFECALIGSAFDFGAIQTMGYTPGGGLDAFNGEPTGGVWTLTITDGGAGDGGCLNTSTLEMSFTGPGVPLLAGELPTIVECDDNSSNTTFVYDASCGQETVRYTDNVSGSGCDGTEILRTWVATDDKGNSGECTQIITVESIGIDELDTDWFWPDTDVPTIACLDGSEINPDGDPGIHLTCGADASPESIMKYYIALFEECLPPPSPDAADYPVYRANLKRFARSKAFPYTVTTEGCGSDTYPEETAVDFRTNSCNMIFTYQDHVLPACGSDCAGNEKVIREWTALDWCSAETITMTQIIHSKDNEGPTVDLATTAFTVSADPWGCVATFVIPAPEHLVDNCSADVTYTVSGPATVSYTGGQWVVTGAPRGVHTFTYTATDCCGNQGTAEVVVTVIDNTPPIASAIQNIKVGMTYSPTNPEGASTAVYVDQINNGSHDGDCGRVKVAIRRMDDESCANIGENGHNNNSTFFDFNNLSDNIQNPLNHDTNDTDGGQFVKFCCADLFNEDFDGGDADGDGVRDYVIIPVELGVWDDADGDGWPGSSLGDKFAVTWSYVRVEAQVAPVLNCPADASIACELDENSDVVIDTYLGRATAASYCGVLTTSYSDECDDDFNKACHHGEVIRTWTIDGTETSCEQVITILEPTASQYFSGSYYLLDTNGDYILQNNGSPIENDNVTYPFEGDAVDVDGDDFDDYSEIQLECPDDMVDDEFTWVAESCGLIGMTVEVDTVYVSGSNCLEIIKKYCVIDWCQYEPNQEGPTPSNGDMKGNAENPGKWCWTVVGKLRDDVAPTVSATDEVFPAAPATGGSGGFPTSQVCAGTAQMSAVASEMGDCPSELIKWVVLVDLYDDNTIEREYSSFVANDSPQQIPYWTDSNGNGIPDVRVGWGHGFDNGTEDDTNGTVSGATYTINIPDLITADCSGDTQHRVSWTAYDGCGNSSSTVSYFTIRDQKAPTPYCINLSTALMDIPVGGTEEDAMVELWAIDFDAGSFDNCTADEELLFTFTDDPSTVIEEFRSAAMTFTCDDLAGGNPALLTLPVYVWDNCGNRDFCLVNVRLTDNNNACGTTPSGSRAIAGIVTTEEGVSVEGVEVMNEQMPNNIMGMEMTTDIGFYEFADNDGGMDYEISASKNTDYLNGVSTIDLVKIQRHILGLELLDSPYKMIAADVNSDGAIDGRDLVELRKLILGIYTELPQNDSWRFVDATQTLDIDNPWNFSELLEVKDLDTSMTKEDFTGVKIGDVNNSVVANSAAGITDIKSGNSIDLAFADVQVEVGQEVEVAVNANLTDLYGYQFTMSTPGLQLVNVTAGELDVTEGNFGVFNNTITTSWNSTTGVNTTDNLFTMTFKSNVSGKLSEILGVNNSITSAEAYLGANLEIVDIALNNVVGSTDFALHQNEPNPFSTTTEIGFVMAQEADATMTVYDVTGKVITVINGNYPQGYNTIELSKSDLGASGVLYYQLDSGDFTATKKMIIIE